MLRRLSQNTAILLLNNLGTAGLAFVLSVLIGRGLGDAGLGRYAAVMAWILPLTLLADFGISTLITRDVAQDYRRAQGYIHRALRLRWLLSGGLVLLVWLAAPLMSRDSEIVTGLRTAVFLVLIDSIFGVYTAVWRAWENMLPILILNIGLLSLQVGGAALALYLDAGINGVLAAVVLADAVQLGAAWLLWRFWFGEKMRQAVHETPSPDQESRFLDSPSYQDFLRRGGQFAAAGVLAAVQARMMFLLLESFSTAQVVGWFAAASRFIEAARMPPFALFGAVFPAVSALVHQPDTLKRTFNRIHAGLAFYGILAAVGFSLIARPLIRLTFGAAFANAAPVLILLGWALIPGLLRQNQITLYYARHQERLVNRVLLAILPLQLLFGIILIPTYGGEGAALTLLLAEGILMILLWRGNLRLVWLAPLLIILVGLALRLDTLRNVTFDGLYGQDAFAYFDYGMEVKNALAEWRVPGAMYWGLGFPAFLASVFTLFDASAKTAQTSVLITGALSGGVMFLLAHDLLRLMQWSKREAVIAGTTAGLLTAGCGQLIQSSAVVMADVPGVLWSVLSAWFLVRYARTQRRPWIATAAIALALAGMTRWIFMLLALPWGLFCLQIWNFRPRWRDALLAVICGGVLVAVQLAHTRQNPDALFGHSWLENWSPENALQHDFVNPDGTFHYETTVSRFYASAAWDGYYIHPVFFPLMLWGVLICIRRFQRSLPALILLLGWIIMTYGFLVGIPYQNIRFSLAFFPPLAAFAGIGMAHLWQQLDHFPALGWAAQGMILLAGCAALTTTYQAGKGEIQHFAEIKNADLNAITWATEMITEENADVYTLNLWLMMQHYAPRLNALQVFYETPESLAAHFDEETPPTYVLLNLWAVENQWAGKAPWTAYHWLLDHRGLTEIGRYGNYYLLRVNEG